MSSLNAGVTFSKDKQAKKVPIKKATSDEDFRSEFFAFTAVSRMSRWFYVLYNCCHWRVKGGREFRLLRVHVGEGQYHREHVFECVMSRDKYIGDWDKLIEIIKHKVTKQFWKNSNIFRTFAQYNILKTSLCSTNIYKDQNIYLFLDPTDDALTYVNLLGSQLFCDLSISVQWKD